MRNLSRFIRLVTATAALGGAAVLAGCTGGQSDAGASPTASTPSTPSAVSTATPTPSPTSRALSATDPSAPYDPADATRWTDGIASDVTTQFGLENTPEGITAHLDAETTQSHRVTALSLTPGDYSFHLACRGGGELVLAITTGGVASPVISGPCTGSLTSGDFTAAEGGTEFLFTASGDPVDVALYYNPAS
ncbi:hypothetical protein ACEXQB_014605 [Herbiconiux sp. P18]|uniref:hypothetical protein n=1 Tax=Herbiconiux liangxiaofengii TaxID=3342795 RepID=UPI0035BB4EC2